MESNNNNKQCARTSAHVSKTEVQGQQMTIDLPDELLKCFELKCVTKGNASAIYRAKLKQKVGKLEEVILKVVQHPKDCHLPQCRQLRNEYEQLTAIEHHRIIEGYSYQVYTKPAGAPQRRATLACDANCGTGASECSHLPQIPQAQQAQQYCVLALQNCKRDLYKQVARNFPRIYSPYVLRQWFREVCEALSFIHNEKHTYHLDIKPENILLTFENKALLSDFGFATHEKELLKPKAVRQVWFERSKLYTSPEVLALPLRREELAVFDLTKMDWGKVDVFALGATMFSMYFLISPFEKHFAGERDARYQYLVQKNYDAFWKAEPQVVRLLQLFEKESSPQLVQAMKNLLQSMLSWNPAERPTIKQVLEHEFFQLQQQPQPISTATN